MELLDAIDKLSTEFDYDVAVVNYAFMSAVFERVPAYTLKILLTHDSFSDRNRRMLSQGFPEASWVSLDRNGEALAFRRADVVVALQDGEASEFRLLAGPDVDVRVVGPIQSAPQARRPPAGPKLRIGYCGSGNYVNEFSLAEYLTELAKNPDLVARTEIVVAGRVSLSLPHFIPPETLAKVGPRLIGSVDPLYEFFELCDICINPELGGTGVKIKTLDAMAHGVPIITTVAGAAGIDSTSRFHSAPDVAALVHLTAEIVSNRDLLESVRRESIDTYAAYVTRHSQAMVELLGPPVRPGRAIVPWPAGREPEMLVPDEVRRHAAPYHMEEFGKIFSRMDLRGKHVLEIGSDFHLVSARLFAANGASAVVANNLSDWRSSEPLPQGVTFLVGDICEIDLPEQSFDIVYGICILEHIHDLDRVARVVKRLLRPAGIAYLQGCPVWTSAVGHHVWVGGRQIAEATGLPSTVDLDPDDPVYSFAERTRNPIPDWAHLTHVPEELKAMLISREVPHDHAESIVRYVYNLNGRATGSCSNFKAASEILAAFRTHFTMESESILHADSEAPEFQKALKRYSEDDLSTIGLRLWLTHPNGLARIPILAVPEVSIVIPFYNVEQYIESCLISVLEQDFADFEAILVDDESKDNSRAVAERIATRDERVRIVTHSHNRGLGAARNTGVRHARGQYVFFLDSDDLMGSREVLGRLVAAAKETSCRVVIGSCARLKPDGTVADYDRQRDRESGGRPGGVQAGINAFLGSLGVPGHSYLPLRAWGVLIQRAYYEELGLDYPPGEHEDMPHAPFLYFRSGGVYYDPQIAVLYRERADGLSNADWLESKFRRYGELWREMKRRMLAIGLQDYVGDAAAVFATHLTWKIGASGRTGDDGNAPVDVLQEILADAGTAKCRDLLIRVIEDLPKQPWDATRNRARYQAMTVGMPIWDMLKFHRARLCLGQPVAPQKSEDGVALAPAESMVSVGALDDTQQNSAFQANAAREAAIFAEYDELASDRLKKFPAMLTYGDKAIYFHAARSFRFRGTIVDGGCFVGGSTLGLVEGLLRNPKIDSAGADTRGLIRVYDLFAIDDDYILKHLQESYPDRRFQMQTSFLPIFDDNLRAEREMLQVRPGDVTAISYQDAEPIELFGVDFCKALPITDFIVRAFFPRLLTGALVLQQDFVHEYHPHIHLAMLRLADHFETYVELKWGGTVAYTCIKPITPAIIRERFGNDSSWYADAATNLPLMRRLIEECHYDENRWVFLLTLGMYHLALGRFEDARAAYREALERFPQFVPSELTRRMIGA